MGNLISAIRIIRGRSAPAVLAILFLAGFSAERAGAQETAPDAAVTPEQQAGEEGDPGAIFAVEPQGPRVLTAPTDDLALPLMDESIDAVKRAYSAFQRGYYLTAMELALSRAQLGDAAAQTLVAKLFAEGLGVARSLDDAAFWYGQAAGNGDPAAEFQYAIMLLEGKVVPRDEKRAGELMEKAADAGNALAQFNHAQRLVAQHPGEAGVRKALPYFEKSADQGVPDAQYALAQIYMNSLGIPSEKRATARDWMRKSAEAGYDTAQLDLAIWLIDGKGGDKDYERGFHWMEIAAAHGNVVAQNRLAVLYINAVGTRPDPVEAAKWYILSKRAGYNDPSLDDFYQGLTAEEQKQALERANKFNRR